MIRTAFIALLGLGVFLAVTSTLQSQDPCSGQPLIVSNADPCGLTKGIEVADSTTVCQIECLLNKPEDPGKECGIVPSWIGGTVQFDEKAEFMFNFIPSTVRIAEITPEGMQSNTCQISEDPKNFDGGFWYIPYNLKTGD